MGGAQAPLFLLPRLAFVDVAERTYFELQGSITKSWPGNRCAIRLRRRQHRKDVAVQGHR
jgi:hypothetical protein